MAMSVDEYRIQIRFLDEKIKNGKLPLNEEQLINYIIFNVLMEGSKK